MDDSFEIKNMYKEVEVKIEPCDQFVENSQAYIVLGSEYCAVKTENVKQEYSDLLFSQSNNDINLPIVNSSTSDNDEIRSVVKKEEVDEDVKEFIVSADDKDEEMSRSDDVNLPGSNSTEQLDTSAEDIFHGFGPKYECYECSKTYAYKHYFKKHIKLHPKKASYTCVKHCQKTFGRKIEWVKHIKYFCLTYICKMCSKSFCQESSLSTHLYLHTKPDSKKYICNTCGRSFSTHASCKRHMSTAHSSLSGFTCRSCSELFTSEVDLYHHVRQSHKIVNYTCKDCKESVVIDLTTPFYTRSSLIHTCRFHCHACSASFTYKKTFYNHLLQHQH